MYQLPPLGALVVYYLFFVFLFWTLDNKTTKILRSLVIAFGVTLVGTEYWELPIFIYAWLGLFNHKVTLLGEIHHVVILFLFISLIIATRLKLTKTNVSLLFLGVFASFVLLPPSPLFVSAVLTRAVALSFLGFTFYIGSEPKWI